MTRRLRRGFTMLEAVVALAIIGMVCVGVLGAYSAAARADSIAAQRLPLAALATERLAALDLFPGSLDRVADSVARGNFSPPYDNVRWDVATHRVARANGLYDVIVTVTDGDARYSLQTRRFRNTR